MLLRHIQAQVPRCFGHALCSQEDEALSWVVMIPGKRYNASGGGTITDDTDCICSQNIQITFKAREVDNGVPPFPLEP